MDLNMSRSNTTIIKDYIGYGGREETSDLWREDAIQQKKFHYSLYEIEVTQEVDLDTGESRITAIDGIPLREPTGWK